MNKTLLKPYYKAMEEFNLTYNKEYVITLFEDYETSYFKIFLHNLFNENSVCLEIPFNKINKVSFKKVFQAYEMLIGELPKVSK